MVQALEAGTIVAVMAGAIGWFMVLRRQTFAGHTLSVIAFPGAAGATLAGAAAGARLLRRLRARRRWSLSAVAAPVGGGRSGESAAIGTVQAFGLGLGFLFVSLYRGQLNGLESLLFGTFLGITPARCRRCSGSPSSPSLLLAASGGRFSSPRSTPPSPAPAGVPTGAARPRLPAPARARGRGDRQITGALLVFALLVTPAATAQQITARPGARPRALGRARARASPGSGSGSPTSRPTRSASGSRPSPSASTSSSGCCVRRPRPRRDPVPLEAAA